VENVRILIRDKFLEFEECDEYIAASFDNVGRNASYHTAWSLSSRLPSVLSRVSKSCACCEDTCEDLVDTLNQLRDVTCRGV